MDNRNLDKLLEIFNDDPLGILTVKEKKSTYITESTQLIESFKDINRFYEKNGREPKKIANIIETKLFFRLSSIRDDKKKCEILKIYDEYGLLKLINTVEAKSIEDIFNNDSLNIFDDINNDIFDVQSLPKRTTMPDYVASRKACKEFDKYEPLLRQCQRDLREGRRKLIKFKNGQQVEEGHFFVLKGVLLYVDKVGETIVENGVKNARLKCIFENGTESDMLMRSLGAELYKDGTRVTESDINLKKELFDKFNNITDEDEEAGYIYILKSKSEDKNITSILNLYKIGFSTTKVEERIKNAENEPTYLMAPVKIMISFKCYNMNVGKLETLLHNFFGESCLEIEITDKNGDKHKPREWFIAPLEIIENAIKLIINGQIINYKYDSKTQNIVYR
ncbi:GIY-YIG nuclease family protein [Clostridium gasigenes]|uniref:GIY-YIG nuclease family protein n=1 Tax=Clostridium gasigenes TaxID=94869 RepID=UPI001C0DC3EF|nr:GIY-YIG nuclease family protein [Clostridium gasigenes]MBU3131970.1 GIY-YIG nuclease family protein [Clostridium gasigenes]